MTDDAGAMQTERRLGAALSAKVRELRQAHGLTLDLLAERAGLSKGTVVALEQGKANPSIGVLCRLAAAFSVSVADLLNGESTDAPDTAIESTAPALLWRSRRGSRATLVASTSGRTMFELWSWTIVPGDVHRSDGHSRGTRELISVTGGRLEVTVGTESRIVKAGEAVRLVTEERHSYAAVGDQPVSFTMAVLERGGEARSG